MMTIDQPLDNTRNDELLRYQVAIRDIRHRLAEVHGPKWMNMTPEETAARAIEIIMERQALTAAALKAHELLCEVAQNGTTKPGQTDAALKALIGALFVAEEA